MSYWQEAATEHFPDVDIQTPADLYIHVGQQIARKVLSVAVDFADIQPTNDVRIDEVTTLEAQTVMSIASSFSTAVNLAGYGIGYKAMMADSLKNDYSSLDTMLMSLQPKPKLTLKERIRETKRQPIKVEIKGK